MADLYKVYVGNLPYTVTDDQLKQMFAVFGDVTDAVVIKDKFKYNRSKGFGFVTFANEEEMNKAINEMNEKDMEGRKLVVNVARPREDRPRDDRRY